MTDTTVSIVDTMTLDDIAACIKSKLYDSLLNFIDIGKFLQAAKPKFHKSTDFYIWAEHNFNMKKSSVYSYVGVAERFQNLHARGKLQAFNFRQLVEMLALPAGTESEFIDEQKAAGVDVATLSTRQLKATIKKFKDSAKDIQPLIVEVDSVENTKPVQEILPFTVDVVAEIKTSPAMKEKKQKGSRPSTSSFNQLPRELIDAAESAGLSISMQFECGVELPANDGVLVTRLNGVSIQKLSATVDAVIFTPPISFTRTDGAIKKIKAACWYFGGDVANFVNHFGKFGAGFTPLKAKNPCLF